MISSSGLLPKRNWIPLAFLLTFIFCFQSMAQTDQTVYARVAFHQVPGGRAEYEKFMKESVKPIHALRKQNGKIFAWRLFKVHNTGAQDEYQYVAVSYYDSWTKTEQNENFPELTKAAHPNADAAAITAKLQSLRTTVKVSLYHRVDFVSSQTPYKYIIMNFMKVRNDMFNEYLKAEREDWKPVHKNLVDSGKRIGWGLWELVLPSGSTSSHDYVTANVFSNYASINENVYEEAFKKAHPGKDIQPIFDQTAKTRNVAKAELWELIDSL